MPALPFVDTKIRGSKELLKDLYENGIWFYQLGKRDKKKRYPKIGEYKQIQDNKVEFCLPSQDQVYQEWFLTSPGTKNPQATFI